MLRTLAVFSLLMLTAHTAAAADPPQPPEDLDEISEFNRDYWRWRRCVHKYETVHGPSQESPPLCGPEPKLPGR